VTLAGARPGHRRERRDRPTASTRPAQRPTAVSCGHARRASVASRRRPRGASCAPNLCTPSRPAADVRHPHGSSRASDRPTPRSSPRTHPPAAAAQSRQPNRHRLCRGHAPSAQRSCDHSSRAAPPAQRAGQVKRFQDLHHFLS
jgi:hypothetical protein